MNRSLTRRRSNRKVQTAALFITGAGLILLAAASLILLLNAGAGGGESGARAVNVRPVEVNYPAPELPLVDLEGNPVALSDFRGQVVLLNNWATWCPPCKAEMPVLQAYYDAHKEDGFVVLAIEAGEPAAEVGQFVQEYGLTFPVWPDEKQISLATFRNLSLPNSYVIDRTGRVRLAWTGAITGETLEETITPLIEE